MRKLRSMRLSDEEYARVKQVVQEELRGTTKKECVRWAKNEDNQKLIRYLICHKISLEELRAVRPIIDLLREKYGF